MKVEAMYNPFTRIDWEDFSDRYEKGLRNSSNAVVKYRGVTEVFALMTVRGRVLASKGMSVNQLQYMIDKGYVK